MRKYYGEWEIRADKQNFEDCINLKYDIQLVAGIYQNDMTINHENIYEFLATVNKLINSLGNIKQDVILNLGENLNPCEHTNVGRYEDFCPHKGYSSTRICQDCGEEV